MKLIEIESPYIANSETVEVIKWINKDETRLKLEKTDIYRYDYLKKYICGANYRDYVNKQVYWVLFSKVRMIKTENVGKELHWIWEFTGNNKKIGVYLVEDSQWVKDSIKMPSRINKHYILCFYSQIIEVICYELWFGLDEFNINRLVISDSRFAKEFFRRADEYLSAGLKEDALENFELCVKYSADAGLTEAANNGIIYATQHI